MPRSAESTRAAQELERFQSRDALSTVVVYERPTGLSAEDIVRMREQAATMGHLEAVTGRVAGPFVSSDGRAAQTIVTFDIGAEGWSAMTDKADQLRSIARISGVDVHVTGPGGQAADSAEAFEGIDSTLLYAAGGVVILLLLLTYRSPVLWILPVVSAVVALTVSQAIVYLVAERGHLTVNAQSQGILTVLVFGAGTDYALLLVARYREELHRHLDRHVAMARALRGTAPAVIASAATVMSGMLCLVFAEMNSTSGLGPVAAIGVAVSLLVMLTLLPALLVITGRWVFWPRRPAIATERRDEQGIWGRVGRWILPRPRPVWIATAVVLGIAAVGALRLDASGLPAAEAYTHTVDSELGQQVLDRHAFRSAAIPILVSTDAAHADAVRAAISELGDRVQAGAAVVRDGEAYVPVAITAEPSSQSAFDDVRQIRAAAHRVPGADALVGGQSAVLLDIQEASARDDRVLIPLILAVIMLVLMILLRALLSPLLLIGTVVLSYGAALGLSTLLFREILGFRSADSSFPLYAFVFLVALGIDYNIFLMSRVREETHQVGTVAGSVKALATTGGVITSAGLVLASTFLVLATLPVVAFVEIGVAVGIGVLLDTLVVRSILVTALNLDLGARIWWPSRLDRSRRPSRDGASPLHTDEAHGAASTDDHETARG
ncbi:MMPL family transporter [Kribbella sp. NPDC003505]|uniref:MMPL family transporter n=1 Tax=Kribbella sp. NPDC003505 TaxID=3154448 RepID=UPI0033A25831